MAKAKQVKGKIGSDVFNMSAPSLRVTPGKIEVKPEEGKVIKWGAADDLPHEYLRLIADSGTASSCLYWKQKFIFADGFSVPEVAKSWVNETQTADALLQDAAGDLAAFSGVAFRVRYVEGEVMAENLPFECVRKLDNGYFVFNPTMGQKDYKKDKNELLPAFSTREKLIEEAAKNPKGMAEKGQIYYYYEKVKGAYEYPLPVYASTGGLADMENDAEIALYDLDEVKSGFRLNAILTAIGDFEDTVDAEGNIIPNADKEDLKANIRSFTERKDRTEARKKILLLTAPTQEMLPNLQAFNNTKGLELMDAVTERIANKVCRNWLVPPVLIGLAKPGQLGQTQEIANMMQLFQMHILGHQNMVQRIFNELWPQIKQGQTAIQADWTITTLNPLQFIPDYILGWLNPDQQKTLISRYI